MNEFIFFIQVLLITGFTLGAKRLGKEALTAWVSIQALIANLFVLKQISLFGLEVTSSDAFVIGSLLGLNFLQENHGQSEAYKATKICFLLISFFALVSQLHILYRPNAFDISQSAFEMILSPSLRLTAASVAVFLIVQQIDIRLFSVIKNKWPQVPFSMRAGATLVVSQLLDTILFTFAGLYGIVESVLDIFMMSFLIKIIVITCFTACTRLAKA